MNSLVQLDSKKQNFTLEITSYKDINGNSILLKNPVHFEAKIVQAKLRIPLKFQKDFYNKYEHFEPTESCPLGYGTAECYNPKTKPPQDGAENYVLCCMESKRGTGKHCLRYDYNAKYEGYEMQPFQILHEIHVNLTSNGKSTFFQLTNYQPKITIKNFGSVQMIIKYQIQRPNELKFDHILFRDVKFNEWFFINKYQIDFSKLTRSSLEFKAFASCSGIIHSETKTSDDEEFVLDQFYSFRNNSIEKLFEGFGWNIGMLFEDGYSIEMDVESDLILLDIHLDNIGDRTNV